MGEWESYYQIFSYLDDICNILIAACCCEIWTRAFLNRKEKAWLTGAAYTAVMLIINYIPLYVGHMFSYFIGALTVFLVMSLIDREYILQNLFLTITFFCLRWQALCIVVNINNKVNEIFHLLPAGDEAFWFLVTMLQFLWFHIFSFLFLYGAVKCILWSYGCKREYMDGKEFLLLSIPSTAGVVFYGVIRYCDIIYSRDTGNRIYDLYDGFTLIMSFYMLFSFAIIFVMTYVFRQWKTQQEEDKQQKIFSAQISGLQNHISEVERLYRDLRGLRHDMGNHLMTLEQLYDKGEYEAAGQYAESLRKEIQDISGNIASGNPVTDVILSGRKKEMEEKRISFVCDFHYPMTESINSFDISIILNNALSNAIEAVEREPAFPGRTANISLTSLRRKNMYIIEVTNNYTGELKADPESGLPLTSKSGEGHGFGLAAIRRAAQKYLGDMEIRKETFEGKERCVLQVMLQITEK